MRRTILLAGVLPFVTAFLGGSLAINRAAPSAATAQSLSAPEVRASAFVLVGSDGTVLARLRPSTAGNGLLELDNTEGTRRLSLTGGGEMDAYDTDGATLLFRAGRTFDPSPVGDPPVNGVVLGPGGTISQLP